MGRSRSITGAGRGQGAAEAQALAAAGAQVVVTDVLEEIDGVAAAIGDAAVACKLDVSDEDQWRTAVELAHTRFGGLHVLVNNVGISPFPKVVIVDHPRVAEYRRVLDINLIGALHRDPRRRAG